MSRAATVVVLLLLGAGALCVRASETANEATGAPPSGRNGLIVFASKRAENQLPQIYSITPAGTRRSRLSRPVDATTSPLLSPDGSRFVYQVGAGAIYVARSDGRGRRRVGFGDGAVWAPDSRRLAYTSWAERGPDSPAHLVIVVDVVTGAARELAEGFHPTWSPDGRRIAVSRYVDGEPEPAVVIIGSADGEPVRRLAIKGIATWARRGGRIAVEEGEGVTIVKEDGTKLGLIRAVQLLGSNPVWSPDGRRLALAEEGRVVVARFDGRDRRVVARTNFNGWPEDGSVSPAWSPTGRWVAFADRSQIHVVRLDGTRRRAVTHERRGTRIVSGPSWGRSGRIFYGAAFPAKDYDLYTMRADGSRVRRLTRSTVSEAEPVWSPDGTKIAFTRRSKLFVFDTLNGQVRRVAVRGVPDQWDPSWSPDGSQIVFVGFNPRAEPGEEIKGIYTVPSSGGKARRIYHQGFSEPRWSPDGRLIAFGAGALYVMRPDGSAVRKVADTPSNPGSESCFYLFDTLAWAPSGGLAFVYHYECQGNYTPEDNMIELVRLDGSLDHRLDAHSTGRLAWSPDGRWLLQSGEYAESYFGGYDQDGEIVRMRGDGTERLELTRGRSGIDPDWQPACDRRGSARADRLEGTAAGELICGLGGGDTVIGRMGSDRLFGEEGNDRFVARDGEFDVVGCGPGRDSVQADTVDLVGRDCERVVRR